MKPIGTFKTTTMTKQKIIWTLARALTFIVVGIMNTLLIRAEDVGTWKNYLGYFLLLLAVVDITILIFKLKRVPK